MRAARKPPPAKVAALTPKQPAPPQVAALTPGTASFDGDWVFEIVGTRIGLESKVSTRIVNNKFSISFSGGQWHGNISGKIDKRGTLIGSGSIDRGSDPWSEKLLRFSAEYLPKHRSFEVTVIGSSGHGSDPELKISWTRVSTQ